MVNWLVAADGMDTFSGGYHCGGGGAGGSLWFTVQTLNGTGNISRPLVACGFLAAAAADASQCITRQMLLREHCRRQAALALVTGAKEGPEQNLHQDTQPDVGAVEGGQMALAQP